MIIKARVMALGSSPPAKPTARELIMLELYRQGEISSGKAAELRTQRSSVPSPLSASPPNPSARSLPAVLSHACSGLNSASAHPVLPCRSFRLMSDNETLDRLRALTKTLQQRLTDVERIRARLTVARQAANTWPDLPPTSRPVGDIPELPYFRRSDDDSDDSLH